MNRTVTASARRPSARDRRRAAARRDMCTGLLLAFLGAALLACMVAGAVTGTMAAGAVLGQPFGY